MRVEFNSRCYQSATEYDPSWYKAWHAYAYMNFEAVLHNKNYNAQNQAAAAEKIGLVKIKH